ncbi:hypothetical protein PPERSA_00165 [Pseudocohnilembus persalinus]|uniref:Uncharacterized protein n=1 Tax=Pseudocohnilembus persalinus TaxID=266149 RepID=A0A0V0QIB0_PSEPJ|nr:hypothetical protein PPERSA_00165 [Pseudocohnilembus persalinus]|eukprot:KRX01792.1 hypothetical protein PPERSA_00165 [Pseudocohnilembus persalinus]
MSYIKNQENSENKLSDKFHKNDFSNNNKYNTSQQMTYYTDISEQLQASEIYSKQQLNFQDEQGQNSKKFRSKSQLSYNQRGQKKNDFSFQTQNQLLQTKFNQENKLSQQQQYKKLLKSFNNCKETEEDQKFRIQIQNQVQILRKLSCEQEEKSEDEFSQKRGEKQDQIQNQNQKESQNQNWCQNLSQKQNLNKIKQQGRKQVCYSSLDNRVNYSNKVNLMNSQQEQEKNFKLLQKMIKQSKNRTQIEKDQVINLYKKNNSLVSNMMKIFSDKQENKKILEKKENQEKSGFLSENQFSNKKWRSNNNNQQNLENGEGINLNNESQNDNVFQTNQKKIKKGSNLSLGKMEDQSKFGSFSVKNQENQNLSQKNQNFIQNQNFSQNQFSSKTSKFLDEIDRLNQQSQDCKKQINFQKSSSPVKIEQSRFLKGLQDMGVTNFRQNKVYKLLNLSSQNLAIDGDFSAVDDM